MVTLQAGTPTETVSLPNPDLGDTEGLNVETNYREAMNGKPWIYHKSTDHRTLSFTWSALGRGKLLEVAEFVKAYLGETITIVDHNDVTWSAVCDNDTISIDTTGRAAPLPEGRSERGSVTLSFIGKKLSA